MPPVLEKFLSKLTDEEAAELYLWLDNPEANEEIIEYIMAHNNPPE